MASPSLVQSIHQHHKATFRAPLTFRMDGIYNHFHFYFDPDELFKSSSALHHNISSMIQDTSPSPDDMEQLYCHYASMLNDLVFASNKIEKLNGSEKENDNTRALGHCIFEGESILEEIEVPDDTVFVQHCKALSFLFTEFAINANDLTKDLIQETHKTLTYKVPSADGEHWESYGGKYRTHEAHAGFNLFTHPDNVKAEMRLIISELQEDLGKAAAEKCLDPYALGAKYSHKFVNIHPFTDGNGRVCRLILNSILFKYTGTVAILGRYEADVEEYLEVVFRGSEAKHRAEDEDGMGINVPPYGELASLVLYHAQDGLDPLGWRLKESHLARSFGLTLSEHMDRRSLFCK